MSIDTASRLTDLADIGRTLLELLSRENAALKKQDYRQVAAFVDRKNELVRAYETRFAGLAKDAKPEDIAAVDPAVRDEARDVGKAVEAMVEENSKLLAIAIEVQRRVMASIADAALAIAPGPGTYSARGLVGSRPKKEPRRAVPLSYEIGRASCRVRVCLGV